jgi:spermidine/putrescine transport system substrate-binding protein
MSGAFALAYAAAGQGVRPSLAAREKELNIYCWEGYNSDDVLDPFRKEFDAKVRAEGLTSDPDAINRLRAGETKVWDLINVNNPWAREMMWPEGLIKDLPRDRFEPFFEKMLPAFQPPYEWAMDKSPSPSSSTPTRSRAQWPRTRASSCSSIRR